jgi:hypothetical protein
MTGWGSHSSLALASIDLMNVPNTVINFAFLEHCNLDTIAQVFQLTGDV